MCRIHHRFLLKVDLVIMCRILMIIINIVGFILKNIFMIFLLFIVCFVLWLKLNIIILLCIFDVIWVVSTLLINSLNYLLLMMLFIKHLVLVLLNRMTLLKKLFIPFFCLPLLLVRFGVKLPLL